MLGTGQVTAMALQQLRHTQDSTSHRTQGHRALRPLQDHNTANEQNQMRQQPPPAAALRLRFSPLPLPWQAEPKQKSQREKRATER